MKGQWGIRHHHHQPHLRKTIGEVEVESFLPSDMVKFLHPLPVGKVCKTENYLHFGGSLEKVVEYGFGFHNPAFLK